MREVTTVDGELLTLFYGGPFSQWASSPFRLHQGLHEVSYTHAEQYMMAEKARLFGDNDTLTQIMVARDPATQKRLGRRVANFDLDTWNKVALDIVFRGNVAKFSQNPDLLKVLRASAGRTLVEASPTDCIWGIGLAEDDPRCLDRSQWRGTNWLGLTLVRVRDYLIGWGSL